MTKTNPIHNMLNAAKPENHPLVYLKKKEYMKPTAEESPGQVFDSSN